MQHASVTVTNEDENLLVRTAVTNSEGAYTVPLLPTGHYTVAVTAPGFAESRQTAIPLDANQSLTVNFTLRVGGIQQTFTVSSVPFQVDLQTVQAQTVISGAQINEIATNTRNFAELVSLMPGVSTALNSDQLYVGVSGPKGSENVLNFSINGLRSDQNAWTIDGADNLDRGANSTALVYPSVDSIQEFSVQRGQYGAEYGRASSGEIDVITKSGTAQFHGDVYEFFRNDALEANGYFNNFYGVPRPPLRYNDFGGTLAGPVIYHPSKAKTFFFFSGEYRRVITYPSSIATVPTANERRGIFPQAVCLNLSCTQTGTTVASINPAAQAYLTDIIDKLPLPNDSTCIAGCVLTSTARNLFNLNQEIVRIDHVFSPRFTLWGRFENDDIPSIEPGGLFTGNPLPGVATTTTNAPGRVFSVHAVNAFSSALSNDAGYNYSHGAITSDPIGIVASQNSPNVEGAIALPSVSTLRRVPDLSFNTFASIKGFGIYRDFNDNNNLFDNLTKIVGQHVMRVGVTWNWYLKDENSPFGGNQGSFGFSSTDPVGNFTEYQEFANFLTGSVSNFSQTSADYRAIMQQRQGEFYAQDQFKVLPNLTLIYGLRYSLFRQPTDAGNNLSNFDPQAFSLADAPQIDPYTGNLIAGTGTPLNGMIFSGKNSPYGDAISQQNYLNFAPRFGVAWDPLGTGKTSVRAGYGIFFDSPPVGNFESLVQLNPALVTSTTINNTTLDDPASVTPFVGTAPSSVAAHGIMWRQPYTQQWSLDVQRELSQRLLLDIGYYGNTGKHLNGIVDINQPLPGQYVTALAPYGVTPPVTIATTPQLNYIRPYRGYGPISSVDTIFSSNYSSLQASLQKRIGAKSFINVNYTYSHALTDAISQYATPQNTYDIAAEYGPAEFDRRHIFGANFAYFLPWFERRNGVVGHLLGGWEISGIVAAYTGTPYTAYQFFEDPAGQGVLGVGRMDQVADPNKASEISGRIHTLTQWFNTSAFALVPTNEARPGNSRNGCIHGPGLQRWDLSLLKNTRITDRITMQFRVETFNVFNHTNLDSPGNYYASGLFGYITGTRDPRVLQLGLKIYF